MSNQSYPETQTQETKSKPAEAWIYFSPKKTNGETVAKFILGTKRSLDIAIYSLTSNEIVQAIKVVRGKGIQSRVLCDKQQASIKAAKCSEVGGIIDKKSGLMHNKFIVRDSECVLTGSYNFTDNATYRNRENFMILCDEGVAETYQKEFDKLWAYNE